MKNPSVSVIIPIYNMENHLDYCLKSILSQDEKDFEVILVNDGSTDRSEAICNSYVLNDKRFILLNKKNGGVSSARNMGLEYAKGRFILFVDADDFISKDYLTIDKGFYDCDIIEKSAMHVNYNNSAVLKRNMKNKSAIMHDKKSILTYFVSNRNNALWDKLISREVIGSTRFDESMNIGEDFIFYTSLIHKVKSYGISKTGYYGYRIHSSSIMQSTIKATDRYIDNLFRLIPKIYSSSDSLILAKGLIARYNIIQLYRKRKYLGTIQRNELEKLFSQIRFHDLYYLNTRWKCKFIVKKYSYKLYRLLHQI